MTKPFDSDQRLPRFFCQGDLSPGMQRDLPLTAAHHASRVLRLNIDDLLKLFNGSDQEWDAVITRIERDRVSVRVLRAEYRSVEPPFRIALAQGMSSREKMDLMLQKATELGISEIYPIVTRRSVIKLDHERADRRVAHWQGVVVSACEQCGRNRVPEVHGIQTFEQWVSALPSASLDLRLLLSPNSTTRLRDFPAPSGVLLLVGPEGGLTKDERDIVARFGFREVILGPRVLRTETAPLAALAAIHALWGDF